MGNYLSPPSKSVKSSLKRKRESSEQDSSDEEEKDGCDDILDLHTPKRKKLKTTSKYIYETLFINGENSDITIIALEKKWKLHKVYLCQSGYFASMFSGSWKESTQSVITIDIPDAYIDQNALDVAFGSLYKDDVLIKPSRVTRILAAATLLQLDGLIRQCEDTMKETISSKTVCSYYQTAQFSGLLNISKKCKEWLEMNLMTTQSAGLLREICPELMKELVKSPDLFVMHVEMDIYTMLKKWAFLQLVPEWPGISKNLASAADEYFKDRHNKDLLTDDLLGAFRGIRYQHVLNDMMSANLLEEEELVPRQWLLPLYRRQWKHMLSVEQGVDKGPTQDVTDHQFYKLALRCGRVLNKDGEYCWRWTGYNYGIDLLVTYSNRLIVFKRNTYSQNCPNSVSLNQKRNLMFKVTVASFNQLGQATNFKSSSIMRLSLSKDEESVIMSVDRNMSLPLHISVNILYYTPDKEDEKLDEEMTETLNPVITKKGKSRAKKQSKKLAIKDSSDHSMTCQSMSSESIICMSECSETSANQQSSDLVSSNDTIPAAARCLIFEPQPGTSSTPSNRDNDDIAPDNQSSSLSQSLLLDSSVQQ